MPMWANWAVTIAFAVAGCSQGARPIESADAAIQLDAPFSDGAITFDDDAAVDASVVRCASGNGASGLCMSTTACAALGDHTSVPNHCPGPAEIQCCTKTPNVADNPSIPPGSKLMVQADVTADMTTWAVDILHDPVLYPMFATVNKTFGSLKVLARVEWHSPDFQNSVVHRGVTLYEPI